MSSQQSRGLETKVHGDSSQVKLRLWRVKEVETRAGIRSRHILGHDVTNDIGRASTAIISFDTATMTATTRSGRRYTLEGSPGITNLGSAAWEKWRNDHDVVSESDVTEEYLRTYDPGDTTVTFTKLDRRVRLD